MGIDFRGKGYVRFVRIGKRTVKEGEACAVWDQNGRHREVIGPKLVRLYWSTIRFLEHHVAGDEEFLKIQKRNGTVEHIRGPTELFENPVHHLKVTVEKAYHVPSSASHLLVLHKGPQMVVGSVMGEVNAQQGQDRTVSGAVSTEQTIVTGPTIFFPEPTDSVHQFRWTDKGAGALMENMRVLTTKGMLVRALECTASDANSHSAVIGLELRARIISMQEALLVADPIAECDGLLKAVVLEAVATVQFARPGTSLLTTVRSAVTSANFTQALAEKLQRQAAMELISVTVTSAKPSAELEKVCRKEDDLAAATVNEQLHAKKLKQEADEDEQRLAYLKELKKLNVDLTQYLCSQNGRAPDHANAKENSKKGSCFG
jgi:hypothetical protein